MTATVTRADSTQQAARRLSRSGVSDCDKLPAIGLARAGAVPSRLPAVHWTVTVVGHGPGPSFSSLGEAQKMSKPSVRAVTRTVAADLNVSLALKLATGNLKPAPPCSDSGLPAGSAA